MNDRSRYHHGDLRRALMEAAEARIAAEGADGLSLRALARDVGVTHAAPYRHFDNMGSLLAAVAESGFHDLTARIQDAMANVDDPRERYRRSGVAYLQFAVDRPGVFKVMYGPRRLAPGLPESKDAASAESFDGLVQILAAVVPDTVPAPAAALSAWAMAHGLATLLVDGRISPEMLGLAPEDLDGLMTLASRSYQPG